MRADRARHRLPVLILFWWMLLLPLAGAAQQARLPDDSVYQLDARLTDQSGRAVRFDALRGQPRLVAMFYTSCKFVCPLIIDGALAVEKQLAPTERARLRVSFITMDPQRDTPAMLMATANRRHLDLTRWGLLRPRPGDVRAVAGVLGVRFRALSNGDFNHTSQIVLLDASGRVLARTEKMGSQPDPAFVQAVHAALRQ